MAVALHFPEPEIVMWKEEGTIYNHHENINTIREMMSSYENKDYDRS